MVRTREVHLTTRDLERKIVPSYLGRGTDGYHIVALLSSAHRRIVAGNHLQNLHHIHHRVDFLASHLPIVHRRHLREVVPKVLQIHKCWLLSRTIQMVGILQMKVFLTK